MIFLIPEEKHNPPPSLHTPEKPFFAILNAGGSESA
jgi:hypothetical protein